MISISRVVDGPRVFFLNRIACLGPKVSVIEIALEFQTHVVESLLVYDAAKVVFYTCEYVHDN